MTPENIHTISILKSNLGDFAAQIRLCPELLDVIREGFQIATDEGVILDSVIHLTGRELLLLITHTHDKGSSEVEGIVIDAFNASVAIAKDLRLPISAPLFSDENPSGGLLEKGFTVLEFDFNLHCDEDIVVLVSDKNVGGIWNLPFYRIFADPLNTSGLVKDALMTEGFIFQLADRRLGREAEFRTPEDLHRLLSVIGGASRYDVTTVRRVSDNEVAGLVAVNNSGIKGSPHSSIKRPQEEGSGEVAVLRCGQGFATIEEVTAPFKSLQLGIATEGRSLTTLMPLSLSDSLNFQVENLAPVLAIGYSVRGGRLLGPNDLFGSPSFESARDCALGLSESLRVQGVFGPKSGLETRSHLSVLPTSQGAEVSNLSNSNLEPQKLLRRPE
ncbi:MAG: fructose 1,6-bisphosphatase [Deltaproteobacteria bacterium]|nr:fructose 1,6-bisphosphatase [Deltaproteobacteria bacterium]